MDDDDFDRSEHNEHFLVQVFFCQSILYHKYSPHRFLLHLTILQATRRSSDLRRAAWTVAKPPLPSI
jgi:hypothetical protein